MITLITDCVPNNALMLVCGSKGKLNINFISADPHASVDGRTHVMMVNQAPHQSLLVTYCLMEYTVLY